MRVLLFFILATNVRGIRPAYEESVPGGLLHTVLLFCQGLRTHDRPCLRGPAALIVLPLTGAFRSILAVELHCPWSMVNMCSLYNATLLVSAESYVLYVAFYMSRQIFG